MQRSVVLVILGCVLGMGLTTYGQQGKPAFEPLKLNHEAMDKLGWKLSVQAYTFGRNGVTLFETLDLLKAMDVRYVELYPGQRLSKENEATTSHDMPEEALSAMRQKLKECGIKPVAYGVVGLSKDEAESRKVFEFCRKLGIGVIASEPAEDAFDTLEKLANEFQIGVAIHNHPKASHYWNPETVLRVAGSRSKLIGACADTGHWYRSDLAPLECLKKLEGRIISSHFKDLNKGKSDVPFGQGECDARGLLEELKRQKFRGVLSIEYEAGRGPELEGNVAACVKWFSATAGEMAK